MAKTPPKSVAKKTTDAAARLELDLVQYRLGNSTINFDVDTDGETIWATQDEIATLFDRSRSTVAEHLQNIFQEGELEESAVCRKFRQTGSDRKTYEVAHYNLDAILSVGYRAKSPKATEFRKWATALLRSYIVDGYAINEARLKNSPSALKKLAADIRRLRAEEKNIYAAVRECFKQAAIDYHSQSQACRSFYALVQDKFIFAVSKKTASQLVLGRADRQQPNMGVQHFTGNMPALSEVQIGKNYLAHDELYILHMLCEQFLLYAESTAMRGKPVTMADLTKKLDSLLALNEYPVLKGYKDYLKDKAVRHAQTEYAMWQRRLSRENEKSLPSG